MTLHRHRSGGKQSSTYTAWVNMKARCQNPNYRAYHRYGGRGIRICERWQSFDNFLADMGEKPEWAKGGLDRIDNNGHYEPGNCRWVTTTVQGRDNGWFHAQKTHCPHGHSYSGENLYIERGQRGCKACKARRDSIRHARNRATTSMAPLS